MIEHDATQPPAALDDDALTRKLLSLRGHERSLLVDFLRHLAELDSRRLYAAQGYPSLHAYCQDFLRLSNGSAFRRYTAARLMKRFPVIADLLLDGRLNLVRLASVREVLTEENHKDLLERATLGTERDVEVLAATLKPRPDVSDGVRRLAAPSSREVLPNLAPSPAAPAPPEVPAASTQLTPPRLSEEPPVPASAPTPADLFGAGCASAVPAAPPRAPRMEVVPTSAAAFSVRMRVGPEFLAEFEAVRAALGHKVPDGNFEAVLRECFRITLQAVQRRRTGTTRKCGTSASAEAPAADTAVAAPSAAEQPVDPTVASKAPAAQGPGPSSAKPAEPSRYVPANVRRAVWERDGGRCAFVSRDGRRCSSAHQVQVHHLDPYARGGPATEENLSLRCRTHNLHEAEVAFGPGFMRSLPFWKCEDSARPRLQCGSAAVAGPPGPN